MGTLRGQSPGECNCVSPEACLQNGLKLKSQLGKGGGTDTQKQGKHTQLHVHVGLMVGGCSHSPVLYAFNMNVFKICTHFRGVQATLYF